MTEGEAARVGAEAAEHVIARAVADAGVRDAEQVSAHEIARAGSAAASRSLDSVAQRAVDRGWTVGVARNGRGTLYQEPGAAGDANLLRVMDPTDRYPHGYVRFHNEHGQPIGLDGKPGDRAHTHIPRRPDGTYPAPEGW